MEVSPYILLVRHSRSNLDKVRSYLNDNNDKYSKVFLEMFSYPQKSTCEDTDYFWNTVYELLISNNKDIIFGDSHELVKRATQRLRKKCNLISKQMNNLDFERLYDEYLSEFKREFSIERDPYFLRVIKQQNPDLIIIGAGHEKCLESIAFKEIIQLK